MGWLYCREQGEEGPKADRKEGGRRRKEKEEQKG
jgi:hypothetical protein